MKKYIDWKTVWSIGLGMTVASAIIIPVWNKSLGKFLA